MAHSGCPPSPNDDRANSGTGNEPRFVRGARFDAACGAHRRFGTVTGDRWTNSPIEAARADAASLPEERTPFVVQAGKTLFLVAEEREVWVLAELRFDPATCTFVEERRVRFQWPREVYGRFLSRAIVADDVDLEEANRVADAFTRWMAARFVIAQR